MVIDTIGKVVSAQRGIPFRQHLSAIAVQGIVEQTFSELSLATECITAHSRQAGRGGVGLLPHLQCLVKAVVREQTLHLQLIVQGRGGIT